MEAARLAWSMGYFDVPEAVLEQIAKAAGIKCHHQRSLAGSLCGPSPFADCIGE